MKKPRELERKVLRVERLSAVEPSKLTGFEAHLAACDRQDQQDALLEVRRLLYWILWNRAGKPINLIDHTSMTLFSVWVRKTFPVRESLYASCPEWLRTKVLLYDLTSEIETAVRAVVEPQGVTDREVWHEFAGKAAMPDLTALPDAPQMIPQPSFSVEGPIVQLEVLRYPCNQIIQNRPQESQ
jgi:hypothetical protein